MAIGASNGDAKRQVEVDDELLPLLGFRMVIGWRVGCSLLRLGASMVPKLVVLPVSAMASWW
jgi:hypothetical protein